MNFYIIAYLVLAVMIIGFFVTAYKLLSKLPNAPTASESKPETASQPSESDSESESTAPDEEEKNEKFPYLYSSCVKQKRQTITYVSPFMGTKETAVFHPQGKRKFINVKGIIIDNDFILFRTFFDRMLPGDIREVVKHFEGCLPTEKQIKTIYEHQSEISQRLLNLGEESLKKTTYLYTCGNIDEDDKFNYCINFATGNTYSADCDDNVSAFLVMKL